MVSGAQIIYQPINDNNNQDLSILNMAGWFYSLVALNNTMKTAQSMSYLVCFTYPFKLEHTWEHTAVL